MAQQDFLDHTGKDGSTPGSRIQKAGYDWMNSKKGSMIAENIAAGQNSVLEVMRGWSKSKSHYKNMVTSLLTGCSSKQSKCDDLLNALGYGAWSPSDSDWYNSNCR